MAATGASAIAQTSGSGAWTDVNCNEFEVEPSAANEVLCGYVTVPVRHANPNGPSIQLATVILSANGTDHQPDPLFLAQGGPGGSTIDGFASHLLRDPSSRPVRNRDLCSGTSEARSTPVRRSCAQK